jgi:hypothetical protein
MCSLYLALVQISVKCNHTVQATENIGNDLHVFVDMYVHVIPCLKRHAMMKLSTIFFFILGYGSSNYKTDKNYFAR